jgi:hypothetical protein
MKRAIVIGVVAAVALVMGSATASAQTQRESETVERTLPFPSGGTLHLKNFSGEVRITGGTGSNFVMKAIRTARADRLREIQLRVETVGSRIEVDANYRPDDRRWRDGDQNDNVVNTRFEIQVPAGARLDIDAFSSDVGVTGVTGEQQLKTFSGDITTTGSRNRIDAETFSGRLDLDATGHGASPDLTVETFSGEMRVRMTDNARGEIAFNTFSGSLDAGFPVSLRSSGRRNIRAELPGGSGRTLTFKSFSGSLRLVK